VVFVDEEVEVEELEDCLFVLLLHGEECRLECYYFIIGLLFWGVGKLLLGLTIIYNNFIGN
jgi:hypothetical protein